MITVNRCFDRQRFIDKALRMLRIDKHNLCCTLFHPSIADRLNQALGIELFLQGIDHLATVNRVIKDIVNETLFYLFSRRIHIALMGYN